MVENVRFAVGISTLSVIVPENQLSDVSISGIGGHIAISGCQSLLQSLADTFFERCMVVNPGFAVGISMLCLIMSEI